MSMVHRLIDQLKQRGLHIAPGTAPGQLLLCGPAAEKTPEVLDAVKKFKPALLKIYAPPPEEYDHCEPDEAQRGADVPTAEPECVFCPVCGDDVTDPEYRALKASPVHCNRGGSRGVTDANGVFHPPSERCPYKPGRGVA